MGLALQVILFAIAVALVVQRSAGSNISPSPTIFTEIPPIEEPPGISTHANAPSPISQKKGSVSHLPPVLSPVKSAPGPQKTNRVVPSSSPKTSTASALDNSAPPPFISHGIALSPPPSASPSEEPISNTPISVPLAPVPVALPSTSSSPQKPPSFQPIMPGLVPPISNESIAPNKPDVSPLSTPPPSINGKPDGIPVAAPPNETPDQFSPPEKAPWIHKASRHRNYIAPLTSPESPPVIGSRSPASLPSASFNRHHDVKKNITSPPTSSLLLPPPPTSLRGPMISPAHSYPSKSHANSRQGRYAAPPMNSVSPSRSPFSSSKSNVSPASSPSPTAPPGQTKLPFLSPKTSPLGPSPRHPKPSLLPPIHALPPPPPNEDCLSLICREPFTNTPPGSPCGCVWPMQVGLRLSVALYTFFPLVSELAEEIALGVFMRQRQVRIMGANAASPDPEKTIILIDLVPLGEKFDNTTAYLTSERFWNKQVAIKTSLFGNYEVLYVRYPGLPPSPPSSINVIDGEPYSGHDNNGQPMKPLGVDVKRVQHKNGLNGSVIAIIVLSASVAAILCCAVAWVLLFKQRHYQQESTSLATQPSLSKPSGIAASIFGTGPTSASLSFGSNIATYTGSAKTFTLSDMEKATDNFSGLRILGEGGFGRVYSGVLEDGTKVAVKVLKREDQQGEREFLAEVEMLSRLHHRNLVKLIGICTEVRARCLVYELIPNGSVESHLHGNDKEAAPLDWGARTKIALGAARGLAYLHEDSSPRVIHRDFKSSNILLEHDFTPKVSDFGLARSALDEENMHISTRVMGTFGYVAPEYAMTGHLLVKSDAYSYGVVLLELLTGRKPVDMSQPPGQENLVAWARPLLTNQEDLESIIDSSLGPNFPFNSIAKVSAIASMCVQPEVSHRPFMGEVVQALKLVCDECDVEKEMGSRRSSHEDLLINIDPLDAHSPISNYDSAPDVERGFLVSVSVSDLFRFEKLEKQDSRSFRRHSSSGPLTIGRGKRIWQKLRRLSGGTVSEHGTKFRFSSESH